MYIKFKTKEFATEFINTIKKNKEKSFDFKEFGTWEFNCADEKEMESVSHIGIIKQIIF